MKFRNIVLIVMVLVMLASFVGCGGGNAVVLAPEEAKVQQTVSGVPDAYITPQTTEDVIVGKGTALSRDMQTAVDKAHLIATGEIANFMNSKAISLREMVTREDVEGDDFESMYMGTVSQASSQVIQGAEESYRHVIPEGDKFRAYVVLQLPVGRANKVLIQEMKKKEELWRMFKDTEQIKEMERKVREFEESQSQG